MLTNFSFFLILSGSC